jgi:hypothetical protein
MYQLARSLSLPLSCAGIGSATVVENEMRSILHKKYPVLSDCSKIITRRVSNQTIALTSISLPVFKSNFFMCLCSVFFI